MFSKFLLSTTALLAAATLTTAAQAGSVSLYQTGDNNGADIEQFNSYFAEISADIKGNGNEVAIKQSYMYNNSGTPLTANITGNNNGIGFTQFDAAWSNATLILTGDNNHITGSQGAEGEMDYSADNDIDINLIGNNNTAHVTQTGERNILYKATFTGDNNTLNVRQVNNAFFDQPDAQNMWGNGSWLNINGSNNAVNLDQMGSNNYVDLYTGQLFNGGENLITVDNSLFSFSQQGTENAVRMNFISSFFSPKIENTNNTMTVHQDGIGNLIAGEEGNAQTGTLREMYLSGENLRFQAHMSGNNNQLILPYMHGANLTQVYSIIGNDNTVHSDYQAGYGSTMSLYTTGNENRVEFAQAQEDATVVQGHQLHMTQTGNANKIAAIQHNFTQIANIQQTGDNNNVDVNQQGQYPGPEWEGADFRNRFDVTQSGMGNTVKGTQYGNINTATVTQSGDGNTAVVLQGKGCGFDFNCQQQATYENTATIKQLGNGNTGGIVNENWASGTTVIIEQIGNSNRVASGRSLADTGVDAVLVKGNFNKIEASLIGNNNSADIEVDSEEALLQPWPSEPINTALVEVTGNNNSAKLHQKGTYNLGEIHIAGDLNTASISQTGYSNEASIRQTGNLNFAALEQVGSNTAAIVQEGDRHTANVSQNGSGNTANITQH